MIADMKWIVVMICMLYWGFQLALMADYYVLRRFRFYRRWIGGLWMRDRYPEVERWEHYAREPQVCGTNVHRMLVLQGKREVENYKAGSDETHSTSV